MDTHTKIDNNQFPYITVVEYGNEEYVGIVINQDQHVTSFYDLAVILDPKDKAEFLELGETWWWESNRQIPMSIFCRSQIRKFDYAIKNFITKDVVVVTGPVVSLIETANKRIKKRLVQLVRRTD